MRKVTYHWDRYARVWRVWAWDAGRILEPGKSARYKDVALRIAQDFQHAYGITEVVKESH